MPARPKTGRNTRTMMIVAKTIDDRISSVASRTTVDEGCQLGFRLCLVLPKPPHHVFHIDDRVVHERADRDRHTAERHRVDARAERTQGQHGGRQRQRHRGQGDRSGAEVRQEEQDDDDDEDAAVAQRLDHVVDGDLDEVRLPENPPINLDSPRQFALDRIQLRRPVARSPRSCWRRAVSVLRRSPRVFHSATPRHA